MTTTSILATVVRNTAGRITGFQTPTVVVSSISSTAGALDGGLTISPVGTFLFTNWNTAELEQYSPSTKAHTVTKLNFPVTGSPGGAEFHTRNNSLLVGNYDSEPFNEQGRGTEVYERRDGEWRMAVGHWSWRQR